MLISREDPATADIVALLEEHLADMHAESPPESVHALDVQRLREPHVTFLAARDDEGRLLGVGALAELTADHAELKSMRTNRAFRGQGVAASVLSQLLAIASERGYERVSLETGTQQYFAAAHRLYERSGFTECEPFGTYAEDPFSRFYTLELSA
ncbi:GNAT family N-acetyltransferase [Demequina sp.]|uniref:GNAT family N-acetyltransferase n=1 Tax=Demequina sp. TaxID=2050685 RepID=UPI003D1223F7